MFMLLSFSLVSAAASDPCGKAREHTDRATGEISLQFNGADWKVVHASDRTEYALSVFVHGERGHTLREGWNLDMKLADGQAVRLALEEPAESRSKTDATGSWTLWETEFNVSSDAVQKLAQAPLEIVRMDLGSGPELTEISRARGKKMQSAFACIATILDEA